MANSFFVPFNFEPVSTTYEQTIYSLAAGKYARLTPVNFTTALVADGEELFPEVCPTFSKEFSTSSTGEVTVFTCPENVILEGSIFHRTNFVGVNSFVTVRTAEGVAKTVNRHGISITGTNTTSSTNYVSNVNVSDIRLYPGDYITHKINNGSYLSYTKLSLAPTGGPISAPQFWVSGGASGITVTGDAFIVELFNQIS
jgi:hypothetical protein